MKTQGKSFEVIQAVARFYDVAVSEILGKGRSGHVVRARHVAMYLLREMDFGWSYPDIGKLFERDHTSVMHACKTVKASGSMIPDAQAILNRVLKSDPLVELSDDRQRLEDIKRLSDSSLRWLRCGTSEDIAKFAASELARRALARHGVTE